MNLLKLFTIVLLFAMSAGCASSQITRVKADNLDKYIFRFDTHGLMCKDQYDRSPKSICTEYETNEGMEARVEKLLRLPDSKSIIFHVHGGLNSSKKGLQQARQKISSMLEDSPTATPVFVTWPSGPVSSYSEHLLKVREGRYTTKKWGAFSLMPILFSDALATLGQWPTSVWNQFQNQKDVLGVRNSVAIEQVPPHFLVSNAWKDAQYQYCKYSIESSGCKAGLIKIPLKDNPAPENVLRARWSYSRQIPYYKLPWQSTKKLLFAPIRTITGVLFHGELGAESWRIMKRRAKNIATPVTLFDRRPCRTGSIPCNYSSDKLRVVSGDDLFLKLLTALKNSDRKVHLIGHSMGAIVVNNLLDSRMDKAVRTRAIGDIVYLASADSIERSLSTTSALIRSYREFDIAKNGADLADAFDSNNSYPRVYNHTLNRLTELEEFTAQGLLATGSLLVHIDQFYENHSHPLERTMGSEVNVFSAMDGILNILDHTAAQYSFISWDQIPGCRPQSHSEMGSSPFLKKENWRFVTDKRDKCP